MFSVDCTRDEPRYLFRKMGFMGSDFVTNFGKTRFVAAWQIAYVPIHLATNAHIAPQQKYKYCLHYMI